MLRAGPRPVNEIGERLHLDQPRTSKHLRVLREAGVVEVRQRAQQRLYELRPEPFRELHAWLDAYRKLWDARFDAFGDLIQELQAEEEQDDHR